MPVSHDFEKVSFAKGDVIFEESRDADAAFLITKGEVEIRTGTRSDAPRVVAKLEKGTIVGEMALFDNSPRTGAAVAAGPVEAIRISRDAFRARLEGMDPVMRSIVLMMVKRTRQLTAEVAEFKKHDWRPIT